MNVIKFNQEILMKKTKEKFLNTNSNLEEEIEIQNFPKNREIISVNSINSLNSSSNSMKTHSIISNSEDEEFKIDAKWRAKGFLRGADPELITSELLIRIDQLKEKLSSKNNFIDKLKENIVQDDKVKGDLQNKINDLKNNMDTLRQRMEKIDDFDLDDEELNELMGKINHNEEEKDELLGNPLNDQSKNFSPGVNSMSGVGNALMNEYQVRLYFNNQKSCWGRFKIGLSMFIEFFIPFKKEMKYLFSRYDRSITGIFDFYRFLFLFNFLIFSTASYMLISHLMLKFGDSASNTSSNVKSTASNTDETICKIFLPCAILYSRFSTEEKSVYSFTFMGICVVLFIGLIYKWTDYKRNDILANLFDANELNFSKEVFNPWDWSVKDAYHQEGAVIKLKNIFTIGIIEEEIKDKIKKRTLTEKIKLVVRRMLSLFLSIIILVLDAGLVAGVYFLQAYIVYRDEDKKSTSTTDIIAMFLPSLGIAVINAIIPKLLGMCILIEKWDFNSTIIVQSIWRNYMAKLFTQGVVYLLLVMFLILEKTPDEVFGLKELQFDLTLGCSSVVTLVEEENKSILSSLTKRSFSNYANCKEDAAASTFLNNLLTDFFLRKILPPVMVTLRYLYFVKYKKEGKFKLPYDNINSVANLLMFNIQIYLLIPFFPFILMISPVLLYIDFKYEVMSLKYFFDKPEKLTMQKKSGYFIMTLFTFTMLGIIMCFILLYTNKLSHDNYMECYVDSEGKIYQYYNPNNLCGPFADGERPKDTLYKALTSNST